MPALQEKRNIIKDSPRKLTLPVDGIYPKTSPGYYGFNITRLQLEKNFLPKDSMDTLNKIINGNLLVTGSVTTEKLAAGAITADKIAANSITSNELAANSVIASKIAAGAVTATKISVTSLSAINANLGTITAGTINGISIIGATVSAGGSFILPFGDDTSGALKWVNNNNRIWVDDRGFMGLKAGGGRQYFYHGSSLYALFQSGRQASFFSGIATTGNINADLGIRAAGYLRSDGYLRVDDYSTLFGILYMNQFSIRDIGAMTFRNQEISANSQLFRRNNNLIWRDEDGNEHTVV